MPTLTLLIGADGDVQRIVAYVGGASVEACLRDDWDSNYVFSGAPGTTSLWYPQAHGLPVGTTINSVSGLWRGAKMGAGATYFLYKRMGDAVATSSTSFANSTFDTWVDVSWHIPPPDGGWNLAQLENLQFGLLCQGGGPGHFAYATKVWLVVDYTPPAPGSAHRATALLL